MLRRLISNDFTEFYDKLPDEQKSQFKTEMLNLLQSETNRTVRKKLVDLVAEMSRCLMDDDGNNLWPEFLNMLFVLAKAPSNELKEASLLLFSAVPSVFGNQNSQDMACHCVILGLLKVQAYAGGSIDFQLSVIRYYVGY